jgi:hypothetical protein
VKLRLTSALALGAAALAGPVQGAAAAEVQGHIGGTELVATRPAPGGPAARPPFDRPRAAYRELYRAAERAPGIDPGRDILRNGPAGGGEATETQLRRSNLVLWRALHPEPEPTYPSPELERIAQCESGGDPTAVSPGGTYRGLYQFDLQTWRSVGGRGDPAAATAEEQGRRAEILYARRGPAPWPVCGDL